MSKSMVKHQIEILSKHFKGKILKGEYEVSKGRVFWNLIIAEDEVSFAIYAHESTIGNTFNIQGDGIHDHIIFTHTEQDKAFKVFKQKQIEYKDTNFVAMRREKIAQLQKEIERGSLL